MTAILQAYPETFLQSFNIAHEMAAVDSVEASGPLPVMMVGSTGVGKSALGNLLADSEAFRANPFATSVTKDGSVQDADGFSIADTMGLNDTQDSQVVVRSKITDAICKMSRGIHCFLLVIKLGRYTEAEHAAYTYLFDGILGSEAYQNCVIVVTHSPPAYIVGKSAADRQVEWLRESKNNNMLTELLEKTNKRVLFVCNPPPDRDDLEAQQALNRQYAEASRDALVLFVRQFRPAGGRFHLAQAQAAQKAYNAEQERLAAAAEAAAQQKLDDAAKKGAAEAERIFNAKMADITAKTEAAQETHRKAMEDLINQKNEEIRKEREALRAAKNRGGGLFGVIGNAIDTLFGF